MKNHYLRDQRGVAMLLELVLVAVVLGLVGLALYNAGHRGSPTASLDSTPKPAPTSAVGLANAAAAVTEQDSSADASLSASADSAAGELDAADNDAANLGGSFNASSF